MNIFGNITQLITTLAVNVNDYLTVTFRVSVRVSGRVSVK